MNTKSYQQLEKEINLMELIWDLLEQWKAILITALIVAMLVCGAKYAKDARAIETAAQSKAEAEKQANMPTEERISSVLDGMSEEDATAAMNMATQYEWLDSQKTYLKDSVLMNTDPTQQRVLRFVYYITGTDQNSGALASAYMTYVKSNDFIGEMKDIISPDAEDKYVSELIQPYYETTNAQDEINAHVFNISVIILDDTDAKAVSDVVAKKLSEQSKALSGSFAEHKLVQAFSEETIAYNYDGTSKKTDTINRINNLQNSIKTAEGNLSEEQKEAANEIFAIKKQSAEIKGSDVADNSTSDSINAEAEEEPVATAHFSKKYALLGFILGAMAYAFVYLVLLMLKRQVNYASDAENYTGTRLIGEIYSINEDKYKGIGALNHSKLVDKFRYRGKLDAEKQINKLTDTLSAACKHEGIKDITLLKMIELSDGAINSIEKLGIKVKVLGIKDDDFSESDLLAVENAVYILGGETRMNDLSKIRELCFDYDVKQLGCIFVKQ